MAKSVMEFGNGIVTTNKTTAQNYLEQLENYTPALAMPALPKYKLPAFDEYDEVIYNEIGEPVAKSKEQAFVMYKPDAFERGLVGELMSLVDNKGLRLVFAKSITITEKQISAHYSHHVGKNFWPALVDYITSGTTLACIYEGENANSAIRQLIGQKHPTDSPAGSIRGKYATTFPKNLIHGSDNWDAAQHEMQIFLTPEELKLAKQIAAMKK